MAKTKPEAVVEDAVLYLPRPTIHPDPEQPRVHPDAELQASIDEQGIIQAITVRPHPEIENEWMIVDGERRYLGAAKLKTIPCRIRLDLEDSADRLVTQLTANTGKPLSPIEQAKAFKKILDESESLSQAELAKRLGIARSTIGDRIRLVEIHSAWMKLIESGRLQVSHAPVIHQYRAVPDEYQVKAAKYVTEGQGWQLQKFKDEADVIPIADFRKILRGAFRDYIVKFDDVRSYKGPVLEIEEEDYSSYHSSGVKMKKVKYAADITLWRPIKREADKRSKKARESSPGYAGGQRYESPMEKTRKQLKAAGYELTVRKASKPTAGETEIFESNGWASGIHPQTLLDKLDPTTLGMIQGQYGGGSIVTTDIAAVSEAKKVYREKVSIVSAKVLAPLREKLSDRFIQGYLITGPGAKSLLNYLDARHEESVVALALGIDLDPATISQADAEKVLAALACCGANDFKVPNDWTVKNAIRRSMGSPVFKVAKAATPAPSEPKSKKQQKREARAAGKQVGDPSRKNGPAPSIEELEREEIDDHDLEEEMVEA